MSAPIIHPHAPEESDRAAAHSLASGTSGAWFQTVSPGDDLEFAADGFFDRDDGMHLEHERRKHRTEFVNSHRIVAFHQHVPAPLADSDHEEVDLEIAWGLPLAEDFEDSLLGILVFRRRTPAGVRTS